MRKQSKNKLRQSKKKMKRQYLWALPVVALFTLSSCSNDDTVPENKGKQNVVPAGMTEFAVDDGTTRTMGVYTGSRIDFYWTRGDKLWINNTAVTPPLVQSSKDDITDKAATAKFYFDGTYNAQSYPVRYTGNGNNVGDKVTIKSEQKQAIPNDGTHIGTDGDCGTATATRGADGKYHFTLSHKASYITFVPYYSYEFAEDVKVTQIKITADEVLAGEFNFDDNGLDLTSRTTVGNPKKSITLKLKDDSDNNGFSIPTSPNHTKNAAIMVLAPGTYHNFTVEYRLYDQKTLVYGTVSKNYGEVTFYEGKNKKVEANLPVPHYSSDRYYMWDAAIGQHTWKGFESSQPILNDEIDSHYPKISSDARWYNPVMHPATASRSAKDCPNANEFLWYLMYGEPHWDPSIWSIMKHLYDGGMWLKKLSVIAKDQHKTLQELKAAAPGGTNYTTNNPSAPKIYDAYVKDNTNIKLGKPTNSSDYIFLPTFGYYLAGTGKLTFLGRYGYYWSSTPRPDGGLNAYNLYIRRDKVHVGYGDRTNAHCLWPE
jgi:putative lipoprotein